MANFKKLQVWVKAHELSLKVHRVASKFRGAEYVAVRSQTIRAAMSIPANVVEGRGRNSDSEFARYVRTAINSANELEYHLITARDFHIMSQSDFLTLLSQLIEVRKMLYGLLGTLAKD